MTKRLLFIGNFLSQDGKYQTVGEELVDRLRMRDWSIITVSNKQNRLARLADMLFITWKQRNHYDVAQVDVYSGAAFIWAEAVCSLLKFLGKPFILTLHGGNLPQFSKKNEGRVQRLLASANAVTTPSRYFLEEMSLYCDNLILLPNPIEIAQYEFRIRAKANPQLIWLRAFHHVYNPELVPQVLTQLEHEFSDIHIKMIGPDKGDGALASTQRLAHELNLRERIDFVGAVLKSDVPHWLNQGDLFLNTTNVDNTPISVLEAMACGLIVLSTEVGGIPYLLEQEQDALLVPPNDADAMAAAIRRVLTEPALAETLSQNARTKVEQFDWFVLLPQWEELFINIIEPHQHD